MIAQHDPVSEWGVVAGHSSVWTAAQVRRLDARCTFAVGDQLRGAVLAFRVYSITELALS